jgi:hypothetical protein
MPGSVKHETKYDMRQNLDRLPDANLWDLARNPDARHRMLAIELLIETLFTVYQAN